MEKFTVIRFAALETSVMNPLRAITPPLFKLTTA